MICFFHSFRMQDSQIPAQTAIEIMEDALEELERDKTKNHKFKRLRYQNVLKKLQKGIPKKPPLPPKSNFTQEQEGQTTSKKKKKKNKKKNKGKSDNNTSVPNPGDNEPEQELKSDNRRTDECSLSSSSSSPELKPVVAPPCPAHLISNEAKAAARNKAKKERQKRKKQEEKQKEQEKQLAMKKKAEVLTKNFYLTFKMIITYCQCVNFIFVHVVY